MRVRREGAVHEKCNRNCREEGVRGGLHRPVLVKRRRWLQPTPGSLEERPSAHGARRVRGKKPFTEAGRVNLVQARPETDTLF